MYFDLSEEQRIFSDAISRQIEEVFSGAVSEPEKGIASWRDHARTLAEAGLLGICASTDLGGLGLSAEDAILVATEVGRHLVPFPATEMMLATALLDYRHKDIAASIIDGKEIATVSWLNGLVLKRKHEGHFASGRIGPVAWGEEARWLLAPIADGTGQFELCLIDLMSENVTRNAAKSIDPTYPLCSVELSSRFIPESCLLTKGRAQLDDFGALLAAAELSGLAEKALAITVDYVKIREQFGRPVGGFQAIKHILANNCVKLESIKVSVSYAAWALHNNTPDSRTAVLISKSYASKWAPKICEDAIQCHGGIGFTWDYPLHRYLRRSILRAASFGTVEQQRGQLACVIDELHPALASH